MNGLSVCSSACHWICIIFYGLWCSTARRTSETDVSTAGVSKHLDSQRHQAIRTQAEHLQPEAAPAAAPNEPGTDEAAAAPKDKWGFNAFLNGAKSIRKKATDGIARAVNGDEDEGDPGLFGGRVKHAWAVTKEVTNHAKGEVGLVDKDEVEKQRLQKIEEEKEENKKKWKDGEQKYKEKAKAELKKKKMEKEKKMNKCMKKAGGPCGYAKVDARLKIMLCRSEALSYKPPSPTNRLKNACKSGAMQTTMLQNAKGVRPIIHPRVKQLAEQFLAHKKKKCSNAEWEVYANMTIGSFLQRLVTKRPVVFFGPKDNYMLRDGKKGRGGFERIGKDNELSPLYIHDYLSYEEMELSALLGVSVPTTFINTGARNNKCNPMKGSFEREGVYVGVVGTRFERTGLMDWKHMISSQKQNTEKNGYGKNGGKHNPMLLHWAKFYGFSHFPTYNDVLAHRKTSASSRFSPGNGKKFKKDEFFDASVYRARCELTAEMFLAEANERAKANGAKAWCHIAGLGLGVWGVHKKQSQIQTKAYSTAIRRMSLPHIGAIVFGNTRSKASDANSFVADKDGSRIQIMKIPRQPAAKISKPRIGGKPWLLVAQYAWDGNSYPGNEFWLGKKYFAASGDPAAACSSYISELQNPEVNVEAFDAGNVKVVPQEMSRPRFGSKSFGSKSFGSTGSLRRGSHRGSRSRGSRRKG